MGLSLALLMNSLRRIGAIRAVLVFSTASVFGLVLAVALLNESVTAVQVGGALAMFAGLYAIQKSETPKG